jgi:hypothetical protein
MRAESTLEDIGSPFSRAAWEVRSIFLLLYFGRRRASSRSRESFFFTLSHFPPPRLLPNLLAVCQPTVTSPSSLADSVQSLRDKQNNRGSCSLALWKEKALQVKDWLGPRASISAWKVPWGFLTDDSPEKPTIGATDGERSSMAVNTNPRSSETWTYPFLTPGVIARARGC